jgi:hypothetical protein
VNHEVYAVAGKENAAVGWLAIAPHVNLDPMSREGPRSVYCHKTIIQPAIGLTR